MTGAAPPIKALEHACQLALAGLPVFPCKDDKAPACPHGFKDATRDPLQVEFLWAQHPGSLIGVATGLAGYEGHGRCIDVLDIDLHKPAAEEWHEKHCTNIPSTRTHRTRSGGLHCLFWHREGMRNSAGRIAPGIDVRAEGGYIIWWPATGLEVVDKATPTLWPAWLVEQATPAPPAKADLAKLERGIEKADRYVQAAMRSAARQVATAGEGTRNQTLNAETFALARFIPDGHLTAGEIASVMASAGLAAGLAAGEVEKTIASALRARVGG